MITMRESKDKLSIGSFLIAVLMLVLVDIGEGMTLRSYCLYAVCGAILFYNIVLMFIERDKLFINSELIILFIFFVFCCITYLWALDQALVLYRIKVLFFSLALIVVVVNQFKREGRFIDFIHFYWAAGLILSILCIIHFRINGIIDMIIHGIRLGEDDALYMGINSNTIGLDCASAGIISLYLYIFRKKRYALLASLPTMIIVVATSSRKGMSTLLIGIILVMFFYQMYIGKDVIYILIRTVLFTAALFFILGLVLQMPGLEKAKEQYMGFVNSLIGNSEQIDISTATRNKMVSIGLQQFIKTPILGIGLDNGQIINFKYNNFPAYLHNNYIELLVDVGLVGTIMYYSFFSVLLIKHMKRMFEKEPIVYISTILLIIRLLSDWGRVSYYDYMNIPLYAFWITVACGFPLNTGNERGINKKYMYIR